ncbi:hypothetical protein ACHHYP_11325 [Achlya hypogyna]|uniref:DUF4371 domain-containing protein n=1 Tax=Achlya hypogyna TaxID=1202772 RepID=A0A1V9YJC6_ACHHY|nr:hypothetical protein ACHHYP_11325 [Achlya hypogyna]
MPCGYTGGRTEKFILSQIWAYGASEKHKEAVDVAGKASAMQLMLAKSRELEPHSLLCAYFLDKNQLSYEIMPEQCFLVKDGVDLSNGTSSFGRSAGAYGSYINATSVADIVSVCASFVMQMIKIEINEATSFSITSDESTDCGGTKHLMVLFACACSYVVELVAGTSNAVFAAVMHLLEDFDLDCCNIFGFASNGASVMLGCRKGVAMKVPHLIMLHCPARRLNLAAEDAEGPKEKRMSVVTAICSYFNKPLLRQQLLDEAIERFQAEKLKPLHTWRLHGLSSVHAMSNFYELLSPNAYVIHEDKSSLASFHDIYLANDGFHF